MPVAEVWPVVVVMVVGSPLEKSWLHVHCLRSNPRVSQLCQLHPRGRKRSRCRHRYLQQHWTQHPRKVLCPCSSPNLTHRSVSQCTLQIQWVVYPRQDRMQQYALASGGTRTWRMETAQQNQSGTCAMWMGQHVFSQT